MENLLFLTLERTDVNHTSGRTQGVALGKLLTPTASTSPHQITPEYTLRKNATFAIQMLCRVPFSHLIISPKNVGALIAPPPIFSFMQTQSPHQLSPAVRADEGK